MEDNGLGNKELNRISGLQILCEISSAVSYGALPVGAAFDLLPSGEPGRVKIYFRSLKGDIKFLDRWFRVGKPDRYPTMRKFIDCFPNYTTYPDNAFVVSVEFPNENIEKWCPALKVDFLNSGWMIGDLQIYEGILRALGLFDIPTETYSRFIEMIGPAGLSKNTCDFHRFVGIGFEPDESVHINAYFEPNTRSIPSGYERVHNYEATEKPFDAIRKGLHFLNNSQNANGSWTDFHLPTGESDIWVTSYVLHQLSSLEDQFMDSGQLAEFRHKASHWLSICQKETGGWSNNSSVEEDSDSTSLALLSISRKYCANITRAQDRLLTYVQSDGGIATYLKESEGDGSLATSHCDVTPLSLLALDAKISFDAQQRALDFFIREQCKDGLWHSYW